MQYDAAGDECLVNKPKAERDGLDQCRYVKERCSGDDGDDANVYVQVPARSPRIRVAPRAPRRARPKRRRYSRTIFCLLLACAA